MDKKPIVSIIKMASLTNITYQEVSEMILKRIILLIVLVFAIVLPCSASASREGTMIKFNFVIDDVAINFFQPRWHPRMGHQVNIGVTTPRGLKFGIFFRESFVSIRSNDIFAEKDINYRCMLSAGHAISKKVDLSVLPEPNLEVWNEMMNVSGRLLASNKFWETISIHFTDKEKNVLRRSLEAIKDGKYVPFVMEKGKKGYSRTFADIWSFIDKGNLCIGYGFGYTIPIQVIVDDNKIHLITYGGIKSGRTNTDPDRITLYKNAKEYRIWLKSDRTSEELLQLFEQELKTTRGKIFSLYNEEPSKDFFNVIKESLIGIETYQPIHFEIFKPGPFRVPSGT